jgi:hypothetical protein
MVIATPILSGFTWPLSQMPVFQAFQCDSSHSFSESFSVLIIENGTFSQTTGAI